MEGRERVEKAVENLRAEIRSGSYGPTWVMLDADGEEVRRNMLGLDGPVPDSAVEDMASSASQAADDAQTHAVIRLDGEHPRIIAWDGGVRCVAEPILDEHGELESFEVQWVDAFDPTPRGGTSEGEIPRMRPADALDAATPEQAEEELGHIAQGAVSIYAKQVVPSATDLDALPALLNGFDENGDVAAAEAPVAPWDTGHQLGQVLYHLRNAVLRGESHSVVYSFPWGDVFTDQGVPPFRTIIVYGYDDRHGTQFCSMLRVQNGEQGLEVVEMSAVEGQLLEKWLAEGEAAAGAD